MVTLILLLLIPPLLILYFVLISQKRKIPLSIPCPPRTPILGHALYFNSSNGGDLFNVLMRLLKEYGEIFQLNIGTTDPFLVTAKPNHIEQVLGSARHLEKSRDYRYLMNWLGTGLLTSGGDKWKKHRRIITPAFHFKILEDFVEVFNSTGEILIENLKKQVGNGSFNIVPYFSMFTLDAICETAMGVSVNAQKHPTSEFVKSVKYLCRTTTVRGMSPIKQYDFLYRLTNDYNKEKIALKWLHGFSKSIIKKKQQERNKTNESQRNKFDMKKRKAFLDLLLEFSHKDKDPLTLEELREEVDTFIFEGHDTTSSALSFATYSLAENPLVQKLAYEEQVSIFGNDKKRSVTFQDLQNMTYLELVLKETLRMYPSVPMFARNLSSEVDLDGVIIPKGIKVVIFAYGVHYNPNIYPEPERFNPERFNGITDRSPYAYIPFSAGSRNCIGQKFAMLEMKATLSKLLRNFEILPTTPKHELQLAFESILVSRNGIPVTLKIR